MASQMDKQLSLIEQLRRRLLPKGLYAPEAWRNYDPNAVMPPVPITPAEAPRPTRREIKIEEELDKATR
jgi:hypothetical protein